MEPQLLLHLLLPCLVLTSRPPHPQNRLGQAGGDIRRTGSIVQGFQGLVSGGFQKLGYIPVSQAVSQCEGKARKIVERAVERLRKQGEAQFAAVGKDLEARCRGYVEYAANDCMARINSLVSELEKEGRNTLTEVQEKCQRETTALVNRTAVEEEERFRAMGAEEELRLRMKFEEKGKEEEKTVVAEFEERGEVLKKRLTSEYEERGREEETKIRREFELMGELERKTVELELRKRGEVEAVTIREEFEARGAKIETEIRAEFEERGEEERKKIEEEFIARGEAVRDKGESKCTEMINMACEDVVEGTESEEFCEEFFFFTADLTDEERKRRKRLGLYVRRT